MTSQDIKKIALECGFDACGITRAEASEKIDERFRAWIRAGKHGGMKYLEDFEERSKDFLSKLPKIKSVIVLGINYYSESAFVTNSDQLNGRVARYAWGRDYHDVIPKMQDAFLEKLKSKTSDFFAESAVDTKPIFERSLAQEAGLGFIGKQTQLLSLQFGPWLFLSELLTNLELEPDAPHSGSCGSCRICIDECPTEAIDEGGHIDARKCIAYLTIENKGAIPEPLRPKIGHWVFGCDECLNVCPYTAKQKVSKHGALTSLEGSGPSLNLPDLFQIKSQKEYEQMFAGSAIMRAKRKHLLRNACVVLGNSKSKEAIPVLKMALGDSSELVREHAAWALSQIEAS